MNKLFQIYLNKGYEYFLSGSYREAKKNFKEALKIDTSKSLYSLYVITEVKLNNFLKANALAEEALKIYPHDSEVVCNFAISCAWVGRLKDAEKILISHLARYPNDYLTTINLGKLLLNQNRAAEALEKFLSLVSLKKDEELFISIATCYDVMRNESEATKYCKLILELNPFNAFALSYLNKKVSTGAPPIS